ncbi:tetratricopeptide repeat protein [Candidatus Puniceispirillum sp.]|nr:tetratricopeptide repeat protein [Candidatus Puniceispirillum sp.]
MLNKSLLRILLCLNVTIFSGVAFAAGSGNDYGTTSKMPPSYLKAVKTIKSGAYEEAIPLLMLAARKKPKDADINNLLGFTHRKTGELDKAGVYYRKALKIDDKHKGALEYQGELFLMFGDRAAAEVNLKKLDKICWLGCSELDDLRTAIDNYKP